MNYEEYCQLGSPSAQNIYRDKAFFRQVEVLELILELLEKNDVKAKKLDFSLKTTSVTGKVPGDRIPAKKGYGRPAKRRQKREVRRDG